MVRFWQRTAIVLSAAFMVVAVVAWMIWGIYSSKYPVDTATVLAGVLAPVAIAVTLLMALGTWWWKGSRAAAEVGTEALLAEAADKLAYNVRNDWLKEASRRRIGTPVSAKIWWRWAPDDISAPRSEVTASPVPGLGPSPLPDLEKPGELLGSGEVIRLHTEVYARLPRGRLVLLGGPGSGKTAAMILLLLADLDYRARLTADQHNEVPVPVWLTLGRWNPVTMTLREWTVATMNSEYPHLHAPRYGPDVADEFFRRGRVALFLDGLDEMPEGARAQALKRLGDETQGLRIVITCRPDEFKHALRTSRPDDTAVIELRPVRPKQAREYLLHGQTGLSRQRWEQLGNYLTQNPASVVAQALDNPLTLSLTRDTYSNQQPTDTRKDPTELIDADKFATVEEVREHLFDQFLATAYPEENQRVQATRWLAWVAYHMGTSQDLAWWDIPAWISRWKLRLTRGLVAGLALGLGCGLGVGPWGALAGSISGFAGFAIWFLGGLIYGFIFGLAFGLLAPLRTKPAGTPQVLGRPRKRRRGLAAGLVVGASFTVVYSLSLGIGQGIASGLFFGGLVGLAVRFWPRLRLGPVSAPRILVPRWPRRRELGRILVIGILCFPLLVPVLLAMWATPIADSPSATAVGIYRADRRTSVIYGLSNGLAIGLAFGLVFGFIRPAVGLDIGLAVFFGTALAVQLTAGQVSLLKLTELFLNRHRRNRINFLSLLEDALIQQVLRQAGAFYQFRHAELQKHLARMHNQTFDQRSKPDEHPVTKVTA